MTARADEAFPRQKDLISWSAFWRSARPLVLVLAAVVVGASATTPGSRLMFGVVAGAVLILLGSAVLLGRRHLDEHPARIVHVTDLMVATFVCAIISVMATVMAVVAWATEQYQAKGPAYLIGLAAGAVIGYFSRDLHKAGEGQSWAALHFQSTVISLYKAYFYKLDPNTGRWVGDDLLARWMPDGVVADALRMTQYVNERGVYVSGWNRAARQSRAATVAAMMSETPWNPSPNAGIGSGEVEQRERRALTTSGE